MSIEEIMTQIRALGVKCHQAACEQEVGPVRTELFSIHQVLSNLPRRGYAESVCEAMNPLLNDCFADDDED